MLKLMPWCQYNGTDIYIYRLALYIVRFNAIVRFMTFKRPKHLVNNLTNNGHSSIRRISIQLNGCAQ